MKIDKKTYIYLAIAAVGVVLIAMSQVNRGGSDLNKENSNVSGASPSTSISPVISLRPSLGASIKPTPKPTPGIKIEVINRYKDMAAQFDIGARHLVLDETCSTIVPSNVAYKNNTQIMLDNTASTEPRTLRVGDRSYEIAAKGWYITTLYSDKLPAQLTIFCGNIELGQLDLK